MTRIFLLLTVILFSSTSAWGEKINSKGEHLYSSSIVADYGLDNKEVDSGDLDEGDSNNATAVEAAKNSLQESLYSGHLIKLDISALQPIRAPPINNVFIENLT